MTPQAESSSPSRANRRDFLKTSLTAAAAGTLPLARSAYAAGSDLIRIGLIGCGPGAAVNAMNVYTGLRLVALAAWTWSPPSSRMKRVRIRRRCRA